MRPILSAMLVVAAMLIASIAAYLLTPVDYMWARRADQSMMTLLPTSFGDWRQDVQASPLVTDPQVVAQLAQIYSETISRTFVNSKGQRIMFSLAYGKDQRGEGRAHYPEVCYPAQGFQIRARKMDVAHIGSYMVPVTRLIATHDNRVEPITYWLLVGDELVSAGFPHKKSVVSYGLRGQIPDGLLVRISSLGTDTAAAYALHDQFAATLAESLTLQQRGRLFGQVSAATLPR